MFLPEEQDWIAHRATFLELGGGWPVYLTEFVDGECATAAMLPSYSLSRVRVAQWRETQGDVLWQAEIKFVRDAAAVD